MGELTAAPANQKLRITVLRLAFVAVIPLILFSESAYLEPEWRYDLLEVLGIFLVIFAVLGRFWSILYIGGRKNELVMQDGPYSICRHPLYLFSTIGVAGLGAMLGSFVLTALLGGMTFVILYVTARTEERFLLSEFGEAYRSYAARTPRIWPRISRFHTREEVVFNAKTLKGNFFDALVFLAFIPLVEFLEWVKDAGLVPTFLIY